MPTGPPPKPTALKILHGNPGKRPLPENEPKPRSGLPECPEHLQGEVREAWSYIGRILENMGVMTEADSIALEMICHEYVTWRKTADAVEKDGAAWVGDQTPESKAAGNCPKVVYRPDWVQNNGNKKFLLQLLAEFGMTPASRSRVKLAEGKMVDPMEEFLNGRRG